MRTLLNPLWDQPELRADFVITWQATAREFNLCSEAAAWRLNRGPISGAWAHIKRIDARWTAPFRLQVLSHDIDLLVMPPPQVMKLLRAHARRYYDNELIARLCQAEGMAVETLTATLDLDCDGINWDTIRSVLNNKEGFCDGVELRGLQLVATDALWTEERRWRAGHRGEGSCEVCRLAIGTKQHRLHECTGTAQFLAWRRAAGRIPKPPRELEDPRMLPLALFALPPKLRAWKPIIGRRVEGLMTSGRTGTFYGDGSGKRQECPATRVATWAVWCRDLESNAEA